MNTNTKPTTRSGAKNSPQKRNAEKPRGKGAPNKKGTRATRRKRTSASSSARPEFEQKVVDLRRVARVVAGGRRFSFSVVVIIGDRNGRVGVGIGKGADTAIAIEKSIRNARRNLFKVAVTESMTIPHEVVAKYCSARVFLVPVPGKGLVAGSSVRNVLDLAGVTDITAKVLTRSKNKLNIARATVKALKML